MLEKGLVQVYTGDGKGKTTAAFGLALRAAGQGNKVMVYQFLKPSSITTGERMAVQPLAEHIRVEVLDQKWDMATSFQDRQAVAQMREAIRNVLSKIAEDARRRTYDLIVLDEIVYCLSRGLAELADVRKIIDQCNPAVEIVLTGRDATPELIELADLVTEMKNIKHPFDEGTPARCGIEY
jgi:cob(I)alamin adenosyltransferase